VAAIALLDDYLTELFERAKVETLTYEEFRQARRATIHALEGLVQAINRELIRRDVPVRLVPRSPHS
jgi:hypothetical protein